MNEYIPSAHEPSPNEVAAEVAKMEEELKELQKNMDRLLKAKEQFPDQADDEEIRVVQEEIDKRNQFIGEYFEKKNRQMELDLEPGK
jgi:hypothetical protein